MAPLLLAATNVLEVMGEESTSLECREGAMGEERTSFWAVFRVFSVEEDGDPGPSVPATAARPCSSSASSDRRIAPVHRGRGTRESRRLLRSVAGAGTERGGCSGSCCGGSTMPSAREEKRPTTRQAHHRCRATGRTIGVLVMFLERGFVCLLVRLFVRSMSLALAWFGFRWIGR